MASAEPKNTISADQAVALLGKSRVWFFDRVKEGHIQKESRGRYTLVRVVRGVMDYYDAILTKQTKTQAASRVTEARAREVELRIAERERNLIPTEDAIEVVDMIIGAFRQEMDSLPAAYTRNIEDRKKLEALIDAAKNRLGETYANAKRTARTGENPEDWGDEDA